MGPLPPSVSGVPWLGTCHPWGLPPASAETPVSWWPCYRGGPGGQRQPPLIPAPPAAGGGAQGRREEGEQRPGSRRRPAWGPRIPSAIGHHPVTGAVGGRSTSRACAVSPPGETLTPPQTAGHEDLTPSRVPPGRVSQGNGP